MLVLKKSVFGSIPFPLRLTIVHLEIMKSSFCIKITLKTLYRLHSHSKTIPLTPNYEDGSLLLSLFRDFKSLPIIAKKKKKYTISGILMLYSKITGNITYFDKRTGKTGDFLASSLYDSCDLLILDKGTFFNSIIITFIH